MCCKVGRSFEYNIARMSTYYSVGEYLGSRISTDSLIGTYLGYRHDIFFSPGNTFLEGLIPLG